MIRKYLLIGCLLLCCISYGQNIYLPNDSSICHHPVPQWFDDAKFGIFIHWGLYSVPGYAPIVDPHFRPENMNFFYNPYAEWYYNTMLIDGSPTQKYHREKYGDQFGYYDFIPKFNQEIKKWKPKEWAELIKKSGAKYAVLTTKHHDGFTLWKSKVSNPNFRPDQPTVSRDIVAELSNAVKEQGLKMGLYYSGGIDWSFVKPPFKDGDKWDKIKPQSAEYAKYADDQYDELINKYHPSLLWNDIDYPKLGKPNELFAYFYNRNPEAVVNNRWGIGCSDFDTPEYSTIDTISSRKWETCRGLGNSFGYNQLDDESSMLTVDQLVDLLVDIVSKNGNLLLNIGPKADGTIPEGQKQRLLGIGKWLYINGEAIYGTHPYLKAEAKAKDGTDIRFTQKKDFIYLILLQKPKSEKLQLDDFKIAANARVSILGYSKYLQHSEDNNATTILLPRKIRESEAYVLKVDNSIKH